jgi:hypothetical protein
MWCPCIWRFLEPLGFLVYKADAGVWSTLCVHVITRALSCVWVWFVANTFFLLYLHVQVYKMLHCNYCFQFYLFWGIVPRVFVWAKLWYLWEVELLYLSELFMGIVLCQIIMLVSFFWVFFGQCLCPKYPYLVAMADAKDTASNIKSFLWQNFHMWQF